MVYNPETIKGIITYGSSDGTEFESGRLKVAQGGGGRSTYRPWLGSHVACLLPSPSLTERGQGRSTTRKLNSLTLAWEHSSEGIDGKEEHFRDLQSIGH